MIVVLYDFDQDIFLRRVIFISFLEEDLDKFDFFGILELWRILNLYILGVEFDEQIVFELELLGFRLEIEAKKVFNYYRSVSISIFSG